MKAKIFLLVITLMLCLAVCVAAIEDDMPTAKQHYNEVKAEVLKLTSDAQLIMVYNGSDLVLPGTAHNWQYVFKSESKKRVYQFEYEEDRREIRQVQLDPHALRFNPGMNTIPDDWLDSEQVITKSDPYGGQEYRNTHSIHSYHIELRYLPALKDGTNLLNPKAVCQVGYTGEDPYSIFIDLKTGELVHEGDLKARDLLSDVNRLAQELVSDAQLIQVNGNEVNLEGEALGWAYIYKSENQQKLFTLNVHGCLIGKHPENFGAQFDYFPLPESWMDSDEVVQKAEDQGGKEFRNTHSNWRIGLRLLNERMEGTECGVAIWYVDYDSNSGHIQVQITEGGNGTGTAYSNVPAILSDARQTYDDAQLIYVFGEGVNEKGIAHTWNYILKSSSEQKVIHLMSVAGSICQRDEVGGHTSIEDYLQFLPIPEQWFDSDTIIQQIEDGGGREFRENNPEWNINMYLEKFKHNNKLLWSVNYSANENDWHVWAAGEQIRKFTATEYLEKANAAAAETASDAQLLLILGDGVNTDGSSIIWRYMYKSLEQQKIFQIDINNGHVYTPDELYVDWLRLRKPELTSIWIDSDSVLTVTEQLGAKTFLENRDIGSIYMTIDAHGEGQIMWNVHYNTTDGRHRGYEISNLKEYFVEEWPVTHGGQGFDVGNCIVKAGEEGYFIAGTTESFGGGAQDAWLVKLYENASERWSRVFGGGADESSHFVIPIQQKTGYLLAANTESHGYGKSDGWMLKMRDIYDEEWAENFGNTGVNYVYEVAQIPNQEAFVFCGKIQVDETSDFEYWLVKFDAGGSQRWSYTYGGTEDDVAYSLACTHDGGFAIAGSTKSMGNGGEDVYLIKTDANGTKLWEKTFGGSEDDVAYSLKKTHDNGFILTGFTSSYGEGAKDLWLIKTDQDGNQLWTKTFGGEGDEEGKCVIQTPNHSYAITGYTTSEGEGGKDLWFVKTDSLGNQTEAQTFGGNLDDFGESLIRSYDQEYLITGGTYSYGEGDCDMILLKVNEKGFITPIRYVIEQNNELVLHQNYPNPFSNSTTIAFELSNPEDIVLDVYNVQGILIKSIPRTYPFPGKFELRLDADCLSPGIYIYQLKTGDSCHIKKMMVK